MKEFFLMLIAFACMQTCCNTYQITKDVNHIRTHIDSSRLEITYRDSVAVDSVIVYKVR